MKFSTTWANVMNQNITLKFIIAILSICTFIFCITTVKLAIREPLIIERACYSKTVAKGEQKRTISEIESFIGLALEKRFNTNSNNLREFLSEEEIQYRIKEQEELSKKNIIQKVIVSTVKLDGASAVVEADRLIVAGKVRSSIYFPLKVSFATIDRTESNPYGLVLTKVSPLAQNGDSK